MNKKLLTIAIAAAMVAPMAASADTTLYGRINNSVVHTDVDDGDDTWDVEDNASRLGVKGSEDLGNGLKAVYQLEWHVETADGHGTGPASMPNNRLGYVGLAGGFGTVAVGRQWTPYYKTVDKTDIFQLPRTNDVYLGETRVGDALAYVSPNFNGLTASVALVISENELDMGDDNVDIYNISLDYANGPFSVGASYLGFEDASDRTLWGIAGKYKADNFAIIAQYEDVDTDVGDDDAWAIAAEAYFGNNTVRVKYGETDSDVEEIILGVHHSFSKRTRIFAEYDMTENDPSDAFDRDTDRFGVGIRHDF